MMHKFRRWWNCFQMRKMQFNSIEEIQVKGVFLIQQIHQDVADFRGYRCERCQKYHLERVMDTASESISFTLAK